jgi:hypothetical protein
MNLIEIYLTEVGRHLPARGRADIQAEIRSILQDMLEERSKASGHPVDDELTLEVLNEYGSPQKVAASYAPERYLIGPRLYPVFERLMFAALPITIVLALGLGWALGVSRVTTHDYIGLVLGTVGSILLSVITTLGGLAFVFAILERAVPQFRMQTKEKEWNPRSLLKLSPRDHISTANLITEIIFTLVILLLFDFARQTFMIGYYNGVNHIGWWVCVVCSSPDTIWQTTIFSEVFFRYLPFLNVAWILTIVLDVLLLRRGRWERWTRWSLVGIKGLSIVLDAVLLAGPSLIGITVASLTAAGFPDAEAGGVFMLMLDQAIRIGLGLGILFGGVKIIKTLVRLWDRGGREVAPVEK